MSSTILTNWTVYYADDAAPGAGYKQIRWTGAGEPETNTNTVNELYSAITDLFSIASQNDADDTIPMRAVTPTVYEIGAFDAGDLEPWFIDPESMKHLTGGSLESVDWTRDLPGDGTGEIGIVKVPCSSTSFNITSSDVGDSCTHADGDTGTILYVDSTNFEVWIRPTDNTLANDFDSGSGTITADTSTNTVTQNAVAVTGERLWSNVFTIGTLSDNTDVYVVQNFNKIPSFWDVGHIDRLFLVDDGFDAGLIDDGLVTVYARQYSQLYDHFQADISTGGSNPVPLSSSNDINNDTGIRTMSISGASGTYTVGEVISGGTSQAEGVVTAASGDPTTSLDFYLIGDLTNFQGSETITGADSGTTGTSGTPADKTGGPADISSQFTFTFGATQQDIGDGNGNQPYDVSIDLGGNLIDDFYEQTKYLTRRGSTTTLNGHDGEQYITTGVKRLSYESQTSDFLEGSTLTGQTSGATGVIVADHDSGTTGTLIVRDVRGTFQDGETIEDSQGTPGSATIATDGIEDTVVVKTSPFGTFAGGSFFGARGVWITNVHADDANSYQLIDSNNVSRTPPSTISIAVSGVVSGDRVGVFRSTDTDGTIDKSMFTSASGNSSGNTTFVVNETIPLDTPTSGVIRIVDVDDNTATRERRYSYSSFSGSTFSGITKLFGDESSGLDRNYTTSDTAYVPYIDTEATSSSVSVSVQYVTDRNVVTMVRRKGILPFRVTGSITSSGYSATAIRSADTIVD